MSCITSYNCRVNNHDDTDLDVFFQKLTETMEMEDYINTGKYPDRLKTKIIKKQFPKMEEEFIYELSNLHNKETDNLNDNLNNIKQSLTIIDKDGLGVTSRRHVTASRRDVTSRRHVTASRHGSTASRLMARDFQNSPVQI